MALFTYVQNNFICYSLCTPEKLVRSCLSSIFSSHKEDDGDSVTSELSAETQMIPTQYVYMPVIILINSELAIQTAVAWARIGCGFHLGQTCHPKIQKFATAKIDRGKSMMFVKNILLIFFAQVERN